MLNSEHLDSRLTLLSSMFSYLYSLLKQMLLPLLIDILLDPRFIQVLMQLIFITIRFRSAWITVGDKGTGKTTLAITLIYTSVLSIWMYIIDGV